MKKRRKQNGPAASYKGAARGALYGSLLFAAASLWPPVRVSFAREAAWVVTSWGFPWPWLRVLAPNALANAQANGSPGGFDLGATKVSIHLLIADWGLAVVAMSLLFWGLERRRRRRSIARQDACPNCGYSLHRLRSARCPECAHEPENVPDIESQPNWEHR